VDRVAHWETGVQTTDSRTPKNGKKTAQQKKKKTETLRANRDGRETKEKHNQTSLRESNSREKREKLRELGLGGVFTPRRRGDAQTFSEKTEGGVQEGTRRRARRKLKKKPMPTSP